MKKQLFPLLAIAIFFAQNIHAQLTNEQMGGVYYAYHAPKDVKSAMAPEGYKLVYLSHYGRHGSRWVTSDSRYEYVLQYFGDDSNLTKQGKKAKKLLEKVYANAKGNGGLLTQLGEKQHQGIAKRMVERFPSLFKDSVTISARSSVVNRCRKSMQAFVPEMQSLAPYAKVAVTTDSADMQWISFDSPDEMLLKMEAEPCLDISPNRFLSLLFKDLLKVDDGEKFLMEFYTIASDIQDIEGLKVNLYQFLTEEEVAACYRQNYKKMWYQNGLDPNNHGIPAQCAANLWNNIVTTADNALASGKPAVTLRFGHDTALYRLLSLLGSKTATEDNGSNLYDIVPMAANLQMAFYVPTNDLANTKTLQGQFSRPSAKADNALVCFWLNEKPMQIVGVNSAEVAVADGHNCRTYMYRWGDVKKHLNHFIESQRWKDRTQAINTMVGTAYAVTKSVGIYGKGSEEHGQTLPAVLAPYGMNFWTPQTRDTEKKCVAPYYYPDSLLQGFRASHWIVGGCTQDYGSFTIMPEMGHLRLRPEERATRFYHKDEISHPYYYGVYLPDEHIMAEMVSSTGGGRAAIFRFTPYKDGKMHIVVNPNSDYKEGFIAVDTIHNLIYGYNPVHRIYQGWGEKAGFSGYFVIELNRCNMPIMPNEPTMPTKPIFVVKDTTAYISLNVKAGQPILVRAATSFTSIDAAIANLRAEMPDWDFLGARLRLDSVWQKQLAKIDVEDSDEAKVNEFYGAFYRASFLPHILSDVDGSHPAFSTGTVIDANRNHKAQSSKLKALSNYYGDYSMWDIYRAQMPLLTIIDSARVADMMQSLVTKYEEGGWMPIFPCWNSYTAAMIGDHAASVLADAWVKGIHGFDIKKAYEGVRKNAFESPKTLAEYKDGMGRRALKSYLKYGYIPLEDSVMEAYHTKEQVSRTLEYAYDDFCAAQLAKAVGATSDYKELMRRSSNWKNVINPKTGWADGRWGSTPTLLRKKREWLGNKDLIHRMPFITEGTVMHYSFYVPQDVDGLVKVMGGRNKFIAKLDTLFGITSPLLEKKGRGGSSFYWHGNEPCHQIAYLYSLVGEPRKTQWLVRNILDTEYMDVPGGLSGNDDAGQMSAWYVFSSLGFYPVCPGKPEYVIGVPSFKKVHIGNLNIETEGLNDENRFIGKTFWNGKPYTSPVITHEMIVKGGTLKFIMQK